MIYFVALQKLGNASIHCKYSITYDFVTPQSSQQKRSERVAVSIAEFERIQ